MLPHIQTISKNFIKPINIQINKKKSKIEIQEDENIEETNKKLTINLQIQELQKKKKELDLELKKQYKLVKFGEYQSQTRYDMTSKNNPYLVQL